jgi:hypothetical protein
MPKPYVNLNMRPYDLPLNSEFSPTEDSREKWGLAENLTPSVRDPVFQTEREEHIEAKKKETDPLIITIKTTEEAALCVNKCGRMILSREAIADHMEERIKAFLMQIIDCYDTELYFTIGKTLNQTKSTPSIHFKLGRSVPTSSSADCKMTFASAHHGTLPCIYAYPREAWETWKSQGNQNAPGKPDPKVYLKNSDTYYLNNACTGLATIINQADIDIDGNPTEKTIEFGHQKNEHQKKLREYTIDLLNRAARKEISPIQGLGLFVDKLKTIVTDLKEANFPEDKHFIFFTWQEEIERLDSRYKKNYQLFIAKLLGIHVPVLDRDSINLEEIVYPRHFKILQRKNLYQTQLAFNVDQLKNTILNGANRTPKNFNKAFKWALMKEALAQKNKKIQTIFQRFYNSSGESLEALQRDCEQTCKPALQLVNKDISKKHIKDFFLNFSQYIHNFTIDEAKFSSTLVYKIRHDIRGLSLRKFSEKYNAMFPKAHPLNHEQLRRIEIGCAPPTPGMIGRMAKVLDIHESVLQAGLLETR